MIVCRKDQFIKRAVPSALPYEAWREGPRSLGTATIFGHSLEWRNSHIENKKPSFALATVRRMPQTHERIGIAAGTETDALKANVM